MYPTVGKLMYQVGGGDKSKEEKEGGRKKAEVD